jgi:SAM-dependent methyltransferase
MEKKSCYAAERNKQPILEVLKPRIEALQSSTGRRPTRVLEVASGTGEHAEHFVSGISDLLYQPTEPMVEMHDSIRAWTKAVSSSVKEPKALDVISSDSSFTLPADFSNNADVMICINMIHISPFQSTEGLFKLAQGFLATDGFLLTYGPYRVKGFMVESNVAFDQSLKSRNPEWGVRDLEAVEEVAGQFGFQIKETVDMPSNNLCVVFVKK